VKLVDTTIAVDHLRGHSPATQLLEEILEHDEILLASEVTRFELLAGMRAEETAATEAFFSVLSWVPVDENIARVAGRLAAEYRRAHSGIDAVDYLLAATASVLDAELLTTNIRHFPMFSTLRAPYPT
jgi:predicted nucleic acid-binding protein